MADMHQIRLYQSTWPDAQKLMHKWGAWGHYDGTCTQENCRYAITLGNSAFGVNESEHYNWFDSLWLRLVYSGIFASRWTALQTSFTVHDGTIWRSSVEIVVEVPSGNVGNYDGDYSLLVRTFSVSTITDDRTDRTEQMEEHPYYSVRRPGGCENCMAAFVKYSTRAPQDQIARLTDFNLDCITRIRPCRWLGDLLPIAWDWRLYSEFEPGHKLMTDLPRAPRPCGVQVWTIGRDWKRVYSVSASGSRTAASFDGPIETERGHVENVLKGDWPFPREAELNIVPEQEIGEVTERMIPGQRYLVSFNDFGEDDSGKAVPVARIEQCGIQADTPENRREIAKGMAMNDHLRETQTW
jgi:hypothetical protein